MRGTNPRTLLSKSTFDAFMGRVLEPLPEAEIRDPELIRLVRRADREAQARLDAQWDAGLLAVCAARERMNLEQTLSRGHALFPDQFPAVTSEDVRRASLAFLREIDRQMRLPAGKHAHLRWKRSHLGCRGFCAPDVPHPHQADWEALIADDARRLKGRT